MEARTAGGGTSGLTGFDYSAPAALKRCSLLEDSPALVLFAIMVADAGRWADPDL
jgi:hypothetical protein